jgi:hypothetical protein
VFRTTSWDLRASLDLLSKIILWPLSTLSMCSWIL